ncbi:hypothetical protein [Enhygromyxa salina]|uniref:hypothetical protein n=1 Tax=Enhygromyxa salina TaxID=215803 RepID=UPI000D02F84D|nr:hypothetical protein [Enhygromyxa salina]
MLLGLFAGSGLFAAAGCGDDGLGGSGDAGTLTDTGTTTGDESNDTAGDEQFGAETEITLRISDDAPPPLSLQMGRDEVSELFGDVASEIELLELDSTPLLTNTLNTIKNACGTSWQLDSEDPNHDCSLTALGQTFGGGDWQSSAEFSMVRILTMTPANSVVNGTSLAGVAGVTEFLSLFTGGFPGMLADSLGIPVNGEFLDTQSVVASMKVNLLATHPEVSADGKMVVTLADALTDMATLSTRLGPVGDHPGVLVADYPTHGEVFGPDFEMKVIAESNLRVLDGVDLSGDKDFISVIVDVSGPSFDDEAEFDFTDPDKFSMTGLNPNPSLDLRFAIFEHDGFIESCTEEVSPACIGNKPNVPVGNGLVWTLDKWDLEYMVAYAGLLRYSSLKSVVTKLFIDLVEVGQDGNPGGWAVFNVPLGFLFDEPPAQYVWELINEVAQHNLHHLDPKGPASFPEGAANVEFTLEDIPCGLTGEEAEAAVRPFLQGQASDIAGYLLGNYKENSGPVDFYYRRADDGVPYLFWVAPDDLLEGLPYAWAAPGFYADAALTTKLSSTSISGVGDTMHEKLRIEPGETVVYAADDEGDTYKIRVLAPADDLTEITAYISKRTN